MAKTKTITSKIQKTRIRIVKCNFRADNFFIYSFRPLENRNAFKAHPKFHTYSLFANTQFADGAELIGDFKEEYDARKKCFIYHLARVHYDFPQEPAEQWAFLARFVKSHSFKRVYKQLRAILDPKDPVLSILTDKRNATYVQTVQLIKQKLPKKLVEPFQQLLDQIQDNQKLSLIVEGLPDELADELTDTEIAAIAQLSDDVDKGISKFLRNPFTLMDTEARIGFLKADKLREILARVYPDQPRYQANSMQRLQYGANYLIKQEIIKGGNTYISFDEFHQLMIESLRIKESYFQKLIRAYLHSSQQVTKMKNQKLHFFDDNEKVTTEEVWQQENSIYKYLAQHQHVKPLAANFGAILNNFIIKQQLDLTDEQRSVMTSVNWNKFTLVVGPGGVGKSWTIGKLIQLLREELGLRVALAAPTGKAAKVLSGYTGMRANTIHRLFGITPGSDSLMNLDPPLLRNKNVLVIDEVSMLDTMVFSAIIKVLKQHPKMRIVLVGDEFQLPSVGYGNILHTLIKYDLCNIHRLTKVFRIASQESGIAELANQLRQGRCTLKNHQDEMYTLGTDLAVQNISQPDPDDPNGIPMEQALLNKLCWIYSKLIERGEMPDGIMALTPQNNGMTGQFNLNYNFQRIYRHIKNLPMKNVPYNKTVNKTLGGIPTTFYEDDYVMITKNQTVIAVVDSDDPHADRKTILEEFPNGKVKGHYTYNIINGDTGYITDITDGIVTIKLDDYVFPIQLDLDGVSSMVLGYALTIHKSQGSQAPTGLMAVAPRDTYMLNANLVYTGISRFQERLYLVGNLQGIRGKANTFVNQNRNTILDWRLSHSTARTLSPDNVVF